MLDVLEAVFGEGKSAKRPWLELAQGIDWRSYDALPRKQRETVYRCVAGAGACIHPFCVPYVGPLVGVCPARPLMPCLPAQQGAAFPCQGVSGAGEPAVAAQGGDKGVVHVADARGASIPLPPGVHAHHDAPEGRGWGAKLVAAAPVAA